MIRKISRADVRSLFDVRVATRENVMSLDELASLGITEDSIKVALEQSHCGWLCEILPPDSGNNIDGTRVRYQAERPDT